MYMNSSSSRCFAFPLENENICGLQLGVVVVVVIAAVDKA